MIAGIETTIPLHSRLIADSDFINGDYNINWLERFVAREDAPGGARKSA